MAKSDPIDFTPVAAATPAVVARFLKAGKVSVNRDVNRDLFTGVTPDHTAFLVNWEAKLRKHVAYGIGGKTIFNLLEDFVTQEAARNVPGQRNVVSKLILMNITGMEPQAVQARMAREAVFQRMKAFNSTLGVPAVSPEFAIAPRPPATLRDQLRQAFSAAADAVRRRFARPAAAPAVDFAPPAPDARTPWGPKVLAATRTAGNLVFGNKLVLPLAGAALSAYEQVVTRHYGMDLQHPISDPSGRVEFGMSAQGAVEVAAVSALAFMGVRWIQGSFDRKADGTYKHNPALSVLMKTAVIAGGMIVAGPTLPELGGATFAGYTPFLSIDKTLNIPMDVDRSVIRGANYVGGYVGMPHIYINDNPEDASPLPLPANYVGAVKVLGTQSPDGRQVGRFYDNPGLTSEPVTRKNVGLNKIYCVVPPGVATDGSALKVTESGIDPRTHQHWDPANGLWMRNLPKTLMTLADPDNSLCLIHSSTVVAPSPVAAPLAPNLPAPGPRAGAPVMPGVR